MKGKYLSEIVDINDFEQGKLNLIEAPCGSGKTTFAKTKLTNLTINPILYLIDTAVGKEQLLHSAEPKENYWTGELYWELDGVCVYTYAGYATLCKLAPERDGWAENSVIVCDELQNPIKWSKWEHNDIHQYALGLIARKINIGNNLVIAISATPDKIKEEFDYCIHEVPLHGIPFHYEDAKTDYYCNLQMILNKITPNQKGIVYVPHIRDIIKYQAQLEARGINAAGIWSINNTDHPMNEKQKQIRNYIIDYQKIPNYVDVLFINKACETSININSKVDFMIVHDSDSDTQVQARGRYRNDLQQLYLYDEGAEHEIIIPEEWLNKRLRKTDIDKLIELLNIRDNSRHLIKKPTFIKLITGDEYIVTEKKIKGIIYSIITK